MHSDLKLGTLLQINAGMPVKVPYGRKEVETGIFKLPVGNPVTLAYSGIPGDGQADLVNHGGPDKAVCVYTADHRTHWEKVLGRTVASGAFGENMTIAGGLETEVYIGDVIRVGGAMVQVTQPRLPCFKLALKHDLPQLPQLVQQSGYTGYYLRVLEEGRIASGDDLTLVSRHSLISVFEASRIMLFDKENAASAQRLLALPQLAASWRTALEERLLHLQSDQGGTTK